MNDSLIATRGGIKSSLTGEHGHLLIVYVEMGYEEGREETHNISIIFPVQNRTWKTLAIEKIGIVPTYLTLDGGDILGKVDLKLEKREANIFEIGFGLNLVNNVMIDGVLYKRIEGEFQGKYYGLTVKDSSPYSVELVKLDEAIEVGDYLAKQSQSNGAIEFGVKI